MAEDDPGHGEEADAVDGGEVALPPLPAEQTLAVREDGAAEQEPEGRLWKAWRCDVSRAAFSGVVIFSL